MFCNHNLKLWYSWFSNILLWYLICSILYLFYISETSADLPYRRGLVFLLPWLYAKGEQIFFIMASRAILWRKKYLFDSLNRPKYLLHCCSSFEHGSSSMIPDSWNQSRGVRYASSTCDQTNETEPNLTRDELLTNVARGYLRHNSCMIPNLGSRNGIGGS